MDIARLRSNWEIALPGFTVGLIGGVTAGGLAAAVGQPTGWALTTVVALGLPLGLLGGGYGLLAAYGKVRIGGFAPVALYWLAGFPIARLIHEIMTRFVVLGTPGLPDDPIGFLAYQGIVSAGFAIGFLWLHERLAPRWWLRVSEHNTVAGEAFSRYLAHAESLREAQNARQKARRLRTSSR